MEFKNSKGIYQQIADNLCDRILSGEFETGDKIPSVREQAANLGVNHNTIMRTYMELQQKDIIENKRGIGFFVKDDASDKIMESRRNDFFKQILPEFIHQIGLLKITKKDLKQLLNKLEKNENK